MRALVVYESMYGNTHTVADAIAAGLATSCDVVVLPVDEATPERLDGVDLVVVGGPTHAHSLSYPSTRKAAVEAAHKPDSDLAVDPDAEGPGLREWFDGLARIPVRAAAFDTRIDAPAFFTGRASKGIARRLRHHGCRLVVEPESFLVDKKSHLEADEAARAQAWGTRLGSLLGSGAVTL